MLIVMLILLFSKVNAYCSEVVCDSSLGTTCFSTQSNSISANACPSGQVCSANQMHSTLALLLYSGAQTCVDRYYVPGLKLDGETCQFDSECRSELCIRGNCVGLPFGSVCEFIDDCASELACRAESLVSSTCSYLKNPGEQCDNSDDCTNDSLCYLNTCSKYFSIATGSYIGNSNSLLCETGYEEHGYCAEAPKNQQDPNQPCQSSIDCQLDRSNYGTCICGFNQHGKSYCSSAPGDPEFLDFKEALLKVTKINSKCHSSIAFSERCPDLTRTNEIGTFLNSYYLYVYRPLIIDAPDCILNDIMPFGVGYEPDDTSSSSGGGSSSLDTSTIMILAIVLPFFIIATGLCAYFIRKAHTQRTQPNQAVQTPQARVEMARSIVIQQPGEVIPSNFFDLSDIENINGHLTKGMPIASKTDPSTNDAEETFTDVCDGIVMRPKGPLDDEESASSQLFIRVQRPRS